MVKVTVKKAEQHGNGKTVLKGRASKVSLKLKRKCLSGYGKSGMMLMA